MQKFSGQYGTAQIYINLKYKFDFLFATILLVTLLPFLFLIALLIFLIIRENPIYSCYRVGISNKRFKLYKFKSMRTFKNTIDEKSITLKKDKRIFLFGRFIRITKIDELPQLVNIVLGDMSFIGPRPEDEKIVNQFFSEKHLETLSIRPGLASPGSIFNYVFIEKRIKTEKEYLYKYLPIKLFLEQRYINNISFLYDLSILLKTVFIIIFIPIFRTYPNLIDEYALVKNFL